MLFWPGVLGGGVDSRAGELVGVDGEERVRSEGLERGWYFCLRLSVLMGVGCGGLGVALSWGWREAFGRGGGA